MLIIQRPHPIRGGMMAEVKTSRVLPQSYRLCPCHPLLRRLALVCYYGCVCHSLVTPKNGKPPCCHARFRTLLVYFSSATRSTARPAPPTVVSTAHPAIGLACLCPCCSFASFYPPFFPSPICG